MDVLDSSVNDLPWPFADNSAHMIMMSFALEHVRPDRIIPVFNELWRILKPSGQLLLATYYAGSTPANNLPHTWTKGFLPNSFDMFDPVSPEYIRFSPKPWKIVNTQYDITAVVNIIMETQKRDVRGPQLVRKKKE